MSSKVTRRVAFWSAIAALVVTAWPLGGAVLATGPAVPDGISPAGISPGSAEPGSGDIPEIDICKAFPAICGWWSA